MKSGLSGTIAGQRNRLAVKVFSGKPVYAAFPASAGLLLPLTISQDRQFAGADPRCLAIARQARLSTACGIVMLVVVGYRMGTITSVPSGEPVLSSSTTAEIAPDSDTMRRIVGTSWTRSAALAMSAMHCGVGLQNTR